MLRHAVCGQYFLLLFVGAATFSFVEFDQIGEPDFGPWLLSQSAYAGGSFRPANGTAIVSEVADREWAKAAVRVTTASSGMLSFRWGVSSEVGFDFLEFRINRALVSHISGEVQWETITLELPPGVHECEFSFLKDYMLREGQDTGWFQNFSFFPTPVCGGDCTCAPYEPIGYLGPVPACVSPGLTSCSPASCAWAIPGGMDSNLPSLPMGAGGSVQCVGGVHTGAWHSCPLRCPPPVVLGYVLACPSSLPGTACAAEACAQGWYGSPVGSITCLGYMEPASWHDELSGCTRGSSKLLTARLVQDGWCRDAAEGLVCSGTGSDTLSLEGLDLEGKIPAQLASIPGLVIVSLGNNKLNGRIPSQLANLTTLAELQLRDNQLTGQIPSQLGALLNLEELVLSNNSLTGRIPGALAQLPKLAMLDCAHNFLTGRVPTQLAALRNLQFLNLGWNQLSGEIPKQLGTLPGLWYLRLNMNKFSGPVPSQLAALGNTLEHLSFSTNLLTGRIPTQLANLVKMRYFSLYGNCLSGPIPLQVARMASLETLRLNYNYLTGRIPSQLATLPRLRSLYLNANLLSQQIPTQLGRLGDLVSLFLNDNRLSGRIPSQIFQPSLRQLYLETNQLTGQIPAQFATSNLVRLDLSRTDIVGPLSWTGRQLELLALRNTRLCPIPAYAQWAVVTDFDIFQACVCPPGCDVCEGPGPVGYPCLLCGDGLLVATNGTCVESCGYGAFGDVEKGDQRCTACEEYCLHCSRDRCLECWPGFAANSLGSCDATASYRPAVMWLVVALGAFLLVVGIVFEYLRRSPEERLGLFKQAQARSLDEPLLQPAEAEPGKLSVPLSSSSADTEQEESDLELDRSSPEIYRGLFFGAVVPCLIFILPFVGLLFLTVVGAPLARASWYQVRRAPVAELASPIMLHSEAARGPAIRFRDELAGFGAIAAVCCMSLAVAFSALDASSPGALGTYLDRTGAAKEEVFAAGLTVALVCLVPIYAPFIVFPVSFFSISVLRSAFNRLCKRSPADHGVASERKTASLRAAMRWVLGACYPREAPAAFARVHVYASTLPPWAVATFFLLTETMLPLVDIGTDIAYGFQLLEAKEVTDLPNHLLGIQWAATVAGVIGTAAVWVLHVAQLRRSNLGFTLAGVLAAIEFHRTETMIAVRTLLALFEDFVQVVMGSVTAGYLEVVAGNWRWTLLMLTSMGGLAVRLGLMVHGATFERAQLFSAWFLRGLACLWVAVVFACLAPFLVLPLLGRSLGPEYCDVSRVLETRTGWEQFLFACTSEAGVLRARNATVKVGACPAQSPCTGENIVGVFANSSLVFTVPASLANLLAVDGSLVFAGEAVDAVDLPLLQRVGGYVSVFKAPNLETLVLPRLTHVSGTLEIEGCAGLREATLSSLAIIAGTLAISANHALLRVRMPVFYDSRAVAQARLVFDGDWQRLTCMETPHPNLFYSCYNINHTAESCFCPPVT